MTEIERKGIDDVRRDVGQPGLFSGLRVLELGHIVAGPTTGMVLAELGAEVVKVEEPTRGDQARSSPVPGMFAYLNRGKGSVGLDLKSEPDRKAFLSLLPSCDVLVTNYRKSVLDKLGIAPDEVHKLNPGLIYARVSGYPPGSRYDEPALDEVIQMETGLASQTGPRDRPLRAGASVVDMTAGLFLVIGIQRALAEREANGKGQYVESSLFEAGTFYMGQALASFQMSGVPPVSFADRDGGAARVHGWGVYDTFTTRDDVRLFVAATSNSQWQGLCETLGLLELAVDPAYSTNSDRLRAREQIVPIVSDAILSRDSPPLIERFRAVGVPHGQVRRPEELLDWPDALEIMRDVEFDGKTLTLPALPVRFWDMDGSWTEWASRAPRADDTAFIPELGAAVPDWLREAIANHEGSDDVEVDDTCA